MEETVGEEVRDPATDYQEEPTTSDTLDRGAEASPIRLREDDSGEQESDGRPSVPVLREAISPSNLAGKWVLVTTTVAERAKAEAAAADLRAQLDEQRVSVHVIEAVSGGTPVFKVGVGSYPSQEAVEAVRDLLGDAIPASAEAYRVPGRLEQE